MCVEHIELTSLVNLITEGSSVAGRSVVESGRKLRWKGLATSGIFVLANRAVGLKSNQR